jgi:integrase
VKGVELRPPKDSAAVGSVPQYDWKSLIPCAKPTTTLFSPERKKAFANLARRVIAPALKNAKIPWAGWHAFRRGLATNLHQMGVDSKEIQSILRHSNIRTTLDIYVKADRTKAQEAMERFNLAVQSANFSANKAVEESRLKA